MSNLKDLNKVVSLRCREELIRLGIKGVDFVAKTGLSKQTFSAVFNGVTSAPSGFISALCTYYPADVSYIITGIHSSSASDTTADNGENSKLVDEIDSAIQNSNSVYDEKAMGDFYESLSSALQNSNSVYDKKAMGDFYESLSSAIQYSKSGNDKKAYRSFLDIIRSSWEMNRFDYIVKEVRYLNELMKSRDREIADKERLIKLMMEKNKGTRE